MSSVMCWRLSGRLKISEGDNRNASTDSRDPALGMVDERYVIGHVLAVVWPFENFGGKTA